MNTRTDSEGNKVLFLEEVQSDWGQKGKKEGFTSDKYNGMSDEDAIKASGIKFNAIDNDPNYKYGVDVVYPNGETFNYKNIDNAKNAVIKDLRSNKTPLAPFVTNTNAWTKLGLKVALKEAVKQGADKIAWTTGEQQNARYDLSKSVDGLEYQPQRDGKYDVFAHKGDNNIFYEKGIDLKRIEDVFVVGNVCRRENWC